MPSDQVRITGRTSMGVTLFKLDTGERVTSVFPVIEPEVPDDVAADTPVPDSEDGPEDLNADV